MPSIQSKFINLLIRAQKMKGSILKEFKKGQFVNRHSSPEPPQILHRKLLIEKRYVSGHALFTLRNRKGTNGKIILYFHGGAYIHGFTGIHWKFLTLLAEESRYTIIAPDYPLAPENTYIETYAMVDEVYEEIINEFDPSQVILVGDSAGGGLAVGLAQKLLSENRAMPQQLILLSPWLDLSMTHPGIYVINPKDPMIEPEGLRTAAYKWAGDTELQNWLISPIHGPLKGLPSIHLFIGTRDILCPDCIRFEKLCEEAGVNIQVHVYLDMIHVWMLLPYMPESRQAIDEIINLLA